LEIKQIKQKQKTEANVVMTAKRKELEAQLAAAGGSKPAGVPKKKAKQKK
jgi:hypothetical protein